MIDSLVQISLRQRWLVLLAALAVAAFGWRSYQRLPIDAVPDITNVQVQINSTAPGFAPLEVEQRITFPVETGMAGLPRLEQTRSLSRYGLSQVTVVFREGTDIYFARQLVGERDSAGQRSAPRRRRDRHGTDLFRPRRDLPLHRGSTQRCAPRRRPALHADRSADAAGLGHQTATPQRPWRQRGQHHRRLREADPRHPAARTTPRLRTHLSRHRGRARAQ